MKNLFLISATFLATASAFAGQPQLISTHSKWSVYKADGVCFVASQPEKSEGNYTKRGDPFLMVSHRPKDDVKGEVSLQEGCVISSKKPVDIIVDGKTFELQAVEESAFVKGQNDQKLVQSFEKGNRAVVHATSSRGTFITDTYSLSGFTKANRAAAQACR